MLSTTKSTKYNMLCSEGESALVPPSLPTYLPSGRRCRWERVSGTGAAEQVRRRRPSPGKSAPGEVTVQAHPDRCAQFTTIDTSHKRKKHLPSPRLSLIESPDRPSFIRGGTPANLSCAPISTNESLRPSARCAFSVVE